MSVFMQPGEGRSTLDAIAAAAAGASSATGMFAWASREGLRKFFNEPAVQSLLQAGEVRLIIGLDAVTNLQSLDAIESAVSSTPSLHVDIFLHSEPRIFHPKTIWFRRADGTGQLVTGSGNLTAWGLTNNWEFGARIPLTADELEFIENEFAVWCDTHVGNLVAVTDDRVRARAANNRTPERTAIRKEAALEGAMDAQASVPRQQEDSQPESAVWFLAEMPKGRGTYAQTGFPYAIMVEFFGYEAGGVWIDLTEVDGDGNLAAAEHRHIGTKESVNWSFDLAGARGIPATTPGPIGAFLRLADGSFLYHLVVPSMPDFEDASSLLGALPQVGPRTSLRRAYPTTADVRQGWPTCPLLTAVH